METKKYLFPELIAIDELVIDSPKIEKNKISAKYIIRIGEIEDSIDLAYKYENNVFDPYDDSSRNLASMILAQVAINYGLFCKRITFNGLFDDVDKKVILEWFDNTSKEIYINKLLIDNPFIIGIVKNINTIKSKSYTQAEIIFKDINHEPVKTNWKYWNSDKDNYCILSSGGKDSLLSYALLNEIGKKTFPVFLNESGRHWFTAINSYKYFSENIENTFRVWTNCDRVYNWMLKHFPFIRQDYNSIRADIYPIRLWTVAVFLFGALPVMKHNSIGNLVIGDEYDSTVKRYHKGIMHYDGLYDQSRYFDDNLTRYYMRKGWAVKQFSIIRPLSEMLILKILAKRYPEIQKNQVSCHASHKEDGNIKPCGKCEKCRRIVGMLTAIDIDPKVCGYNNEQINYCLKSLETNDLHQESTGVEHLKFMLHKKGIFNGDKKGIKERKEILSIRIDSEKSPFNWMPLEIRKPIVTIFKEYAIAALKKQQNNWNEIDILNTNEFYKGYPFEFRKKISKNKYAAKVKYKWGELTWKEASEKINLSKMAILPVGAIEQHGPHLPLDVDSFDAEYLAKKVAEVCSEPKPLVLPLISYGVSYHHDDFSGTISISNDTLSKLVYDIGISIAKQGIDKLIIINGHGDNKPTLNYAAQMINKETGIFVAVDTGESSDFDLDDISETPNDVHAGEIETSTILATRPELVYMNEAVENTLKFTSRYLNFSSVRNVPWYSHTKNISDNGIMGDPTKATAEKGEKIWQIMIAHLVGFIEDLKHLELNEIFNKGIRD